MKSCPIASEDCPLASQPAWPARGAAATGRQSVVVDDVSKDPRYLSGSTMVNSEIVVPIFVKGTLAAELDIESYFASTFDKSEQDFVEACAAVVGKYIGKG
jgi:L-methionine (R)-S-oxide reductase